MAASTPIRATYRLQLNKDFTFKHATQLLDYLSELGISHIYMSPILRSRRGSGHGYDVIDPTRLNPELGSEADFASFQTDLRNRGMGLILDIVPNHMSASSENSWWMDVLENGPESAYASYFDVDWHPPSRSLDSKILLPILGHPFGEVLENGEFKLVFLDGRVLIQYFDSYFPLAPGSYARLLGKNTKKLRGNLAEQSAAYQEYSGIVAALSNLANPPASKVMRAGERRLQFEALRERLRQLAGSNAVVEAFLRARLEDFSGKRGDPASFSPLERLLGEQFYVFSHWQNVNEEINYRRFFTITDLVGMRVEDPMVFEATHALIKRLLEQGAVDGLRIDHIDGLRDPLAYLNRLREQIGVTQDADGERIHIFVEKILARTEFLPRDWPAEGTTGYDFLNALNSFFVDHRGARCVEDIYAKFLGKNAVYADLLYQKKKLVMSTLLGVEMRSLGHQLTLLADNDRYARDLSRSDLTQALIETTAHLPVYRTYTRNLEISREDAKVIRQAIEQAQSRKFYLKAEYFEFVRDVLLLQNRPHLLPNQREERLNFVTRWQQFTGPIMAKAFEDTFLYVYNPLISLNEVGGEPRPSQARPGLFPQFVRDREKYWPLSLNATTTHDTKRSEDVRARISVLSEIPEQWKTTLERWSEWNARHKSSVDGQLVPDRNEEIFLYQTLLGAWPLEANEEGAMAERLEAYSVKATREAMVHTRWTLPNLPHEDALKKFVSAILKAGKANPFLPDYRVFQRKIAYCGMINGLSQTLLKMVSPGVPDFYQGSELWDLRLVDPDNRRPVDFLKRRAVLADLKRTDTEDRSFVEGLVKNWHDGRIKLYAIWKTLHLRRECPELFLHGDFVEIKGTGARKDNIFGMLRSYQRASALLIVPRWLARMEAQAIERDGEDSWSDTGLNMPALSAKKWVNIFTGRTVELNPTKRGFIPVSQIFRDFPVALLRS